MATKRQIVELTVAKWGNSLAVRLPAKTAERIGVSLGDRVTAEISADRRLILGRTTQAITATEVRRLRRFLDRQKATAPVVAEMRRGARY